MRKIITILIAGIMLFAALTACVGDEQEPQAVTEPPAEEAAPEPVPQEPPTEDPQPESPEDDTDTEPAPELDEEHAVLQAFYDELNRAIETYGISDGGEGINNAKLVDFENDGIPELMYGIHNPRYWESGGFPDRNWYEYVIVRYHESSVSQFSIVANVAGGNNEILATSNDGKIYLVSSLDSFDELVEDWFTIRDGGLVNVLSIRRLYVYHEIYGSDYAHFELTINDEFLGETDWEGAEELMASGRSEFDIAKELSLSMTWSWLMHENVGEELILFLDELRAMIES